jgi:predicted enzyme involved in methoxymalonyl-ACP biosynthesis
MVLHGQALDKFGDHGIVICATAHIEGDTAELKSFLMSCRVVGRAIETAFLGVLLEELARRGVRSVLGAYIPTNKNALVKDFYATAGFTAQGSEGSVERWLWKVDSAKMLTGDLVKVVWE